MDIRKHTAVKRFSIPNLLIVFILMSCTSLLVRSVPPSQLEQIRAAGELRVLARNGLLSHYQGPSGTTGFEFTLLKGLTDELGVKLVLENDEQLATKPDEAKVDLISPSVLSNLTSPRLRYSDAFMELSLQVIASSSVTTPNSVKDLEGKTVLVVSKNSALSTLRELQQAYADIRWQVVENVEMTDLLAILERNEAEYAVVDSAIYNTYRYSYPHTQFAFNLSDAKPLAWGLAQSKDDSLYRVVQSYLGRIKQNGQLADISARFFNQYIEVSSEDALAFSTRIEKRFPRWEQSIKAAAAEYSMDWKLVAAIGYQESQWMPNAESPTGVRGFMMLTPDTAKELGVKNLDDPKQSIKGGAKYMRNLMEILPDSIQGDDRLYMALAAYNQGIGHLEDARILTEKMRGNPNSWADVSRYFPLLTKQEYYSKAKYGYARGWEPVIYVKNVLNYQKILVWKEQQQELRVATKTTDDTPVDDNAQQEQSALEKLNRIRLSSNSSLSFL